MIPIDQWTTSDNLKLEPNALVAATEIDRNLALTAGPGAGKTEMLAQGADLPLSLSQTHPGNLVQGRCEPEPQGAGSEALRFRAGGAFRQPYVSCLRQAHH